MFADKPKTHKRMFLNAMQLQPITSAKTAEGGVAVTTSAQRKDSHSKDDLCPESSVVTSDESDDSIPGRVKKKSVSFAIDVLPDRNPTDDKEQIVQNNHDTDDCNIAVDEITENLYKQRDKKIAQSELCRYANYLPQNICQVCKKPYSNKNNLKRHLMNIHNYNHMDLDKYFDKTRKYKVKKKISRQQNSSMACHSHSSDINSGPICKLCRRKFKNTDMLFLHLRTFHKYSLKKLRQYFNTCTDKPTLETECDSQEVSIQSVAHTDKQIEQETEIKNQMSSPQTVDLAVGSRPPLLEGTNNINCYKNKKRYLRVCKYCKVDYKSKDLLRLHLSMWRTKCYELYRARNISKSNSQKVSSQSVAHTDNQIEQETDGNSRILSHINTSDDQTVEGQYPSEGTSHNSYEIEKRGVICIYCHKKYTPSEFFQHMRSGFCTTKYNDSNNIMFIETKHGGHEVANSRNAQIEEQIEQETEINNQMSSPKTKSVGLTVGSPKVSSHIIVQTDDQTEQKTEINSQLLSRDQTIGGQTSEGTINDSYKKVKKRRVVCTFCKKKYKSRELLWKHIRNGLCKNHPTITKQDTGRKISSGGIVQIVEENEHGLGTESNSQILKKVSPTVGQDELRVAILKADGNQLNEKQATKVKNLLQRKILTEAKEQFSSSAFLPCFTTEAAFSDGVLKLECKDDLTVKWLRNAVQNLRYYIDKFPKLTLIRQCELNKVSVTLSLPDCDSSLDDVMLVLNRQNKWAFVDTWTVRTHNLLSNGTMFLALAIPEDVFPLLEKENLRLFYNLGSVKLRPYNCYEAVTSKQSSRKEKGRINKNNSRGKYAA